MSESIERTIKLVGGPNHNQVIEEDYVQLKYVKVKGINRGIYSRIVGGDMKTFYWFKEGIPRLSSYKGTIKEIEQVSNKNKLQMDKIPNKQGMTQARFNELKAIWEKGCLNKEEGLIVAIADILECLREIDRLKELLKKVNENELFR